MGPLPAEVSEAYTESYGQFSEDGGNSETSQSESGPSHQGLDWPETMKLSWDADHDECDRDGKDFQQLRNVKICLQTWIKDHGGTQNPRIWDHLEKVTADGKVRKRVICPGQPTTPVKEGMFISWQYTGFVEPNFAKVIDATRFSGRREVFRVDHVGENEMIQRGLRLGVATMNLGETAHFRIHPDYAFGGRGVPPRIPPNAFLHYLIELREEIVDDRRASNTFLRQQVDILDHLGLETCLKAAHEFRERGIIQFQLHKFEYARENFTDGIRAVEVCEQLLDSETEEETQAEVKDIGRLLKQNAAVTNAKLDNWKIVASLTAALVADDANNFKALYYLALAHFHLNNHEEGFPLAARGIKLRPGCAEFAELYAKLEKKIAREKEQESLLYRRMFPLAQPAAVKVDRWALVGNDVRKHVAEEIAKFKTNSSLMEAPLDFSMFIDKLNLSYLEKRAKESGLIVSVKAGKKRNTVRLSRIA
ncbi:hypothetical protein BV898_06429 [Hypsibius exemplaris]|uniref:peptidylprolyl isomerase n=1 Tax=Hypsibius exemplaris TaxID=2072580 RepID=A0A1W0WWR9_HYPEX|nr:hypothetical protein BV898_06429 [Hypsibius exemplaris]